jgi:hypothetical protein
VKEPADRLQGGLRKHKIVQVPPTEKKERSGIENVYRLFRTQTKKRNQFYTLDWQCGTLQNSVFRRISHAEKLLNRYAKMSMIPDISANIPYKGLS